MKIFDDLEIILKIFPEAATDAKKLAEVLMRRPSALERLCACLLEDKEALK